MMNIYIVSSCERALDDDYTIAKVFATKDLAESYVAKMSDNSRRNEAVVQYNEFSYKWLPENQNLYFSEDAEYGFSLDIKMQEDFEKAVLQFLISLGYQDIAEDVVRNPWEIDMAYHIREYEVISE
jgi:hypothetical protein